jgi:hypothetical protein
MNTEASLSRGSKRFGIERIRAIARDNEKLGGRPPKRKR